MSLTVCPCLGLVDDRTLIRTAPTGSHRCYAQATPIAPDVEHQAAYCLAAYARCARFPAPGAVAEPGEIVVNPAAALARPAVPATTPPNQAPASSAPAQTMGRASHRHSAELADEEEDDDERGPAWLGWLWLGLGLAVAGAFVYVLVAAGMTFLRPPAVDATLPVVEIATNTATSTPVPTATPDQAGASTPDRYLTPTPLPGGQALTITPKNGEAGWWASGDTRANHLGDSFLYAGRSGGQNFLSTARFDLARAARGAAILEATLRLTGLKADRLTPDPNTAWLVQLLPESNVQDLARADYLTAFSAPAAITLPPLNASALGAKTVNTFVLDEGARRWLEQQLLDGATSVTLRVLTTGEGPDTLFAWDSGLGPESAGSPPELVLSLGPPPPTPPPLPTKPFLVATLTPVPQNVLTVVAQAATATAVAETTGTYTPIPYQVYTPTPFPANLETVQAVAVARGLPPVLIATPVPANQATADALAAYATAVALTTGTFTPEPSVFVTPIVVAPSPPAENVATAAVRVLAVTATAAAAEEQLLPTATPTPWPYNAVIAVYVYATAVPENLATAIAVDQARAEAELVNGTPTPLPWNAIIITAVPAPITPSATPLPLFVPEAAFTATPTPTETGTPPAELPPEVRGRILFKSDRSGGEGVYMLDPATGAVTLVTQPWVYKLAVQNLAVSPTGEQEAIVQKDDNGILQLHLYSPIYKNTRQLTTLKGANYDPAWSPTGEWIAFVSTDPGGDEIYRVDPTGAVSQRLTFNTWEWDKHPAWSPDGSQIVFYSNRDSGRRQLWIMNADGTGQRNLSSNEYNDWDPIWVR